MKTIIKNTIAIIALTSTISSCSKSDDAPAPQTQTYSVPVSIDFNGVMSTSTINFTKIADPNINICNNYQAIAERKSGKLGFAIFNFNAAGGALNKSDTEANCDKMIFSGEIDGTGGTTLEYYNNVTDGGNITLVGNTYTMICNAYQDKDPNAPRVFLIKATWTKP